jgi:hypothetical protein
MKQKKLKFEKMNKKGLIGQLVLLVLAVIGGYVLLKYFGVL